MTTYTDRRGIATAARIAALSAALVLAANAAARAADPGTGNEKNASTAAASVPTPATKSVEYASQIALAEGKSTLLRLPEPIERISVGDPAVADVILLNPKEIYMLGKEVGATNLILWNKEATATVIDIAVGMDTATLQTQINQLFPEEKSIKVSAAADSLVLQGTVADSAKVDRVIAVAAAFVRKSGRGKGEAQGDAEKQSPRIVNILGVSAPQQVMLEVKVAEISKTLLDRFGINLTRAYAAADGTMMRFLSGIFGGTGAVAGQVGGTVGANVGGGIVGSSSNGIATGAVTGPLGEASVGGGVTKIPLIGGNSSTTIGIDAQKNDGLVKVLAEPTVMAISGQEGSFLAGGKIFIPVAQNDGGGRTITLEEKEFGVSLKFLPTVLEGGRINLLVRPEVSELNREGVGITAPGISGLAILPAFTTRKASTTVQLHDGQSFVIGGLIKNNVTTNIKAFPFLGEIPVIGTLFRSTNFQTDKTELVFVVTPRLVKPIEADYKLPTDAYIEPTRGDVIWRGKLEGTPNKEPSAPKLPARTAPKVAAPNTGFEMK